MVIHKIKKLNPRALLCEAEALLKDGDLLVRMNMDPTSRFIQHFNRTDKSYSHAGVVFLENGKPVVYHIEHGNDNPEDKLRCDSIARFCDPGKNFAFGIFRYNLTDAELQRLKRRVHKWYKQEIKFDLTFNYNTDDRMYCAEMISKALMKSTNNRILIGKTPLTALEASLYSSYAGLPLSYTSQLKVVAIDNLYCNKFCKLVKRYQY